MKNVVSLKMVGRFVAIVMQYTLVLAVCLPLVPANGSTVQAETAALPLHPALVELIDQSPEQTVRIIVQARSDMASLRSAIVSSGGEVIRDLSIINGFVVDMRGEDVTTLAGSGAVRWISPDAPTLKVSAFEENVTVLQEDFAARDGAAGSSVNWNWFEIGEDDGLGAGDVAITRFLGGTLEGLRIQQGGKGVQTEVDLSRAGWTTLSLGFRRKGFDAPSDGLEVAVSVDKGASWQILDRLDGPAADPVLQRVNYDLTPYRTSETMLRLVSDGAMSDRARFYVDFVQIQFEIVEPNYANRLVLPLLSAPASKGSKLVHAASSYSVRDQFDSTSYSNNDGSAAWTTGWIEQGDDGSASGGDITVEVDDCPQSSNRCIEFDNDAGYNSSVERQVDLSNAAAATLSFDYHLDDDGSNFLLEVSADGGSSWTHLRTYSDEANVQNETFDLSAYVSSQTRIRFRLTDSSGYSHFYIDNVEISWSTGAGQPACGGLIQEAEDADLFGAFTIGSDSEASGGQYIVAPEGSGSFYSGADVGRRAEFCFDVPIGGTFQLRGWVYAPDGGSDSFYVAADGVPATGLAWHTGQNTEYTPRLADYDGSVIEAYLSAGQHTITFFVREDGTRLDKVELVQTSSDPVHQPMMRDEFNSTAYNNNDGTVSWSGSWYEAGDDGDDDEGRVLVTNNRLQLNDYPDSGGQPSIARAVDLSDASSASLRFDFTSVDNSATDRIVIEVSDDGGASWVMLEEIAGSGSGQSGNRQYVLHDVIELTAEVVVRFRISGYFGASGEYFGIDNVQITYGDESAPIDTTYLASTYVKTVGAHRLWNHGKKLRGKGVTVAVVDSGIALHPDLTRSNGDSRILTHVDFTGGGQVDDFYGHGTHVAGIIAGNGKKSQGTYIGVAPKASLVDVKVTDDYGAGTTAGVIAGLQWVLENKDDYNIRVVNMSLNSTVAESYHTSPLDAAVEILWINGIVVVVSSGNNGNGDDSGIVYPPANDPFVITVGATDDMDTDDMDDDEMASFSARGITSDGFIKPEIVVPGSDIIASLAGDDANLVLDHPSHAVYGDDGTHYYRMSGTSMAAAVAAGLVALLLEDEPDLTPDQVKHRLMSTSTPMQSEDDDGNQISPGYVDIYAAVHGNTTDSANTGVAASQLLWSGDDPVVWQSGFTWSSVNWNSVNWNSVNWNSVNWNSGFTWGSVHWDD